MTTTTQETDLAGVVRFAGIMLLTLGAFQFTEGLTTLLRDGAYLVAADGTLIELDPAVWGWVHLTLGLISAAAGAGILRGQVWARVVGVLLTTVAALAHFLLLATSPLWCTVLICVEIVVIFALCRRPAAH
jgi:hypothetical protein